MSRLAKAYPFTCQVCKLSSSTAVVSENQFLMRVCAVVVAHMDNEVFVAFNDKVEDAVMQFHETMTDAAVCGRNGTALRSSCMAHSITFRSSCTHLANIYLLKRKAVHS